VLTAAQLRTLPRFLQLNAAYKLYTAELGLRGSALQLQNSVQALGPAARQYQQSAMDAVEQLLQLEPPGSVAYLHFMRGGLLAFSQSAGVAAAYRGVLRCAASEKGRSSGAGPF